MKMKNGQLMTVQNAFVKKDMSIVEQLNVQLILIVDTCTNLKMNVVLSVVVSFVLNEEKKTKLLQNLNMFISGCLNDRFHVQHMNSTWMESNGCMKCWCENGRSRCVVEGCIAPPCENPRQVANVCCPVCADDDRPIDFHLEPIIIHRCPPFVCDKHCPYNYTIDTHTGCPQCQCNSCPPLNCIKNCTYGLKQNELGCPLCICESQRNSTNRLDFPSWPRQCQTGSLSYSNGEIWFDGCRQCLCYKGQILCALISCPILKCSQPILLPNRCCPTCPG